MKKTQEILGLPVISISDASEAGRIKSVIINNERGSIDYFFVESGMQNIGGKVIATEAVLGIGEYATTVLDENSITDLSKVPVAIDLIQRNVPVIGTKVLTKKGNLIGETGDIFVDEDNGCYIVGLEFISEKSNGVVKIIPRDKVITFGKNLVIVDSDVEQYLMDTPSIIQKEEAVEGITIPKINSTYINDNLNINNIEEQMYIMSQLNNNQPQTKKEVKTLANNNVEPNNKEEASNSKMGSAASLFEMKQRQYLKGKKVSKTIADAFGGLLIPEGTLIDDKIIEIAKTNGKMIELVMNNRA